MQGYGQVCHGQMSMYGHGLTFYSELLLRLLSKNAPEANSPLSLILKATDATPAGSTDAFLHTKLEYTKDEHGQDICLVKVNDQEEVGVMMGWERGISESPEVTMLADLC